MKQTKFVRNLVLHKSSLVLRFCGLSKTPVRLDQLIAGVFLNISRSQGASLIKKGGVSIDGKVTKKPGALVPGHAEVAMDFSLQKGAMEHVLPNPSLSCEILYEDAECLVINKAPGMLTHPTPAPESLSTSVASWLVTYLKSVPPSSSHALRPGIVHRLDQFTSGCLLLAKTTSALAFYSTAFEERSLKKEYLALVYGRPLHTSGSIKAPIGRDHERRIAMAIDANGKDAHTDYRVLGSGMLGKESVSLVLLRLHTGRTHQIRVHMTSIGHPVVGDPTYGRREKIAELDGQWLHAWRLCIPSLTKAHKEIALEAAIPEQFVRLLHKAGIADSSWQEA